LQQWTNFCTNFSPKSGGSGGRAPRRKSGGTPFPASPPHYLVPLVCSQRPRRHRSRFSRFCRARARGRPTQTDPAAPSTAIARTSAVHAPNAKPAYEKWTCRRIRTGVNNLYANKVRLRTGVADIDVPITEGCSICRARDMRPSRHLTDQRQLSCLLHVGNLQKTLTGCDRRISSYSALLLAFMVHSTSW